jgi:hypothetical protein
MALMTRCQKFCNRHLANPLTQFPKASDRLVNLGLPAVCLGHEAGDRPAMAGDNDGFAALYLVEDLRQMRLRFGGLDLSHEKVLIGRSD